MALADPLAAEIRARAASRSLTLHALAVSADLSDASLSHRLTGRTPWGIADLNRVALALGTTGSDLLAAAEAAAAVSA